MKLTIQAIRYAVVGGATVLLDYGVLFLLTEHLGLFYITSSIVAFVVALVFNYMLSLWWVFEEVQLAGNISLFLSYSAIGVVALFISVALMWLLTDFAGMYYMTSKAASLVVVFAWNFLARRELLRRAKAVRS
jgi:putative flippase GtrA